MPLTKINRDRDPYEDAFAKARDIRLKRARTPARPKIIIANAKSKTGSAQKKVTH
ncbi:hypothetical protein [Umboniibacter marinipuniceus]|uniref:Uncharacterized protein n=1 Tax=Umboniibacter marinipuniceus TaxID=569599 RepID=A0A3L9ZXM2_9GAMM|nr:hypothetical protein [Umboniibacter marinipuniceus]RMA77631.1 hypothetical protein DFR27_2451 [Umboniibacter marinipuniceus]